MKVDRDMTPSENLNDRALSAPKAIRPGFSITLTADLSDAKAAVTDPEARSQLAEALMYQAQGMVLDYFAGPQAAEAIEMLERRMANKRVVLPINQDVVLRKGDRIVVQGAGKARQVWVERAGGDVEHGEVG